MGQVVEDVARDSIFQREILGRTSDSLNEDQGIPDFLGSATLDNPDAIAVELERSSSRESVWEEIDLVYNRD